VTTEQRIPDDLYRYFGHEPPSPPSPTANVGPINAAHCSDHAAYVDAAAAAELSELAQCPNGARNDTLNIVALKLARLPIDRDQLRNDLIQACHTNGLIRDDGARSVDATIRSAFRKADGDGPREIPASRRAGQAMDVDAATLAPTAEAHDYMAKAVRQRALQIRIDDEARELYADWQASAVGHAIPDIVSLSDFLAVPDEDAEYRIADLWPTGGNVLLAAQFKAGKTTLVANLLRSLADGHHFLGKFRTTTPVGITLFDDELDERMLRRWLRDQNIRNTDRIQLASMKGRLSSFNILNARTRARWAELIHGSDVLILDCLRPCLDALGLDEHRDAGRFLGAWDALKKEAGVSESIIVHHMGHGQERSRGDSRLLDWPDVNWKIVKESQSETEQEERFSDRRFFSALGRDVNVPEGMLQWESEGRTLMFIDGGRGETKAVDAIDIIRSILRDPENSNGLGTVALTRKLHDENVGKTIGRRAIKRAIEAGILLEMDGPRNAKILTLNPSEA